MRRIVLFLLLLCSAYLSYSFYYLKTQNVLLLTFYAAYPESYFEDTSLYFPFLPQVASWEISRKGDEELGVFFESQLAFPYLFLTNTNPKDDKFFKGKSEKYEITGELIKRGLPLGKRDKYGCTSLHRALMDNDEDLVNFLVNHGAMEISTGLKSSDFEMCRKDAKDLITNKRGRFTLTPNVLKLPECLFVT